MASKHIPVALISAGSAGLGAATARLFCKNGYKIVVNYSSNAERANKLLAEFSSLSTLPSSEQASAFAAIKADLTKREDINRLVDESVQQMGRLDVVFSNGGWTRIRDMTSIDDNVLEEDWDRCFNMNVKSHLWLMHAARKYLDETEGSFITTASVAGLNHSGSSLAYSVTKAAQIHLVKGLANMAAPRIRVNSVSPGLLLTEWSDQFSDDAKEAYRQKTKLKRLPALEDVAEQVLRFAKSKSQTGTNAVLDSGYVL
ncbi:putative Short chain dehydrogenase [Seiridium unicorne]|uniref:Short chain dehydrogenase n=1 Tax=Seiridium unicorne TaxID=138068 RepID=A0ABR2V4A0_9PEZI